MDFAIVSIIYGKTYIEKDETTANSDNNGGRCNPGENIDVP